jgi:hypothetical protein
LLHLCSNRFVECRDLFAELGPCCKHWPHDRCHIWPVGYKKLDALSERAAADRPRQHAEGLEHAADVVRQSGHHTNQLKASTQQCAGAVCIKRLYMHRAVPTCAHDLRQSFGIIAVGLVELHA